MNSEPVNAYYKTYPFPLEVRVENTNYCNAACVICPREKMTRPKGYMSLDLFKRIADECSSQHIKEMHLQGFGEPFLDRDIFERIGYAKELNIKNTILVTNGSLLTEDVSEKIVRSGLDRLKISFYGTAKAEYESIHRGIEYEKVIKSIKQFLRIKKQYKSRTPKVTLKYIGHLHLFPRFVFQWWPKTRVSYARLHNYCYGRRYNKILAREDNRCDMVWDPIFQILWDGRVVPCCYDFDGRLILGDLNQQSISEIWNGEKYKKFRDAHASNQLDQYPLCKICDKLR